MREVASRRLRSPLTRRLTIDRARSRPAFQLHLAKPIDPDALRASVWRLARPS